MQKGRRGVGERGCLPIRSCIKSWTFLPKTWERGVWRDCYYSIPSGRIGGRKYGATYCVNRAVFISQGHRQFCEIL